MFTGKRITRRKHIKRDRGINLLKVTGKDRRCRWHWAKLRIRPSTSGNFEPSNVVHGRLTAPYFAKRGGAEVADRGTIDLAGGNEGRHNLEVMNKSRHDKENTQTIDRDEILLRALFDDKICSSRAGGRERFRLELAQMTAVEKSSFYLLLRWPLADDEVVQLVAVSALVGEVVAEDVAGFADGTADGLAALPLADTSGELTDHRFPGIGIDLAVDATIGEDPHLSLQHRDIQQNAVFVGGLVELFRIEGGNRPLAHFALDLTRIEEMVL
jgi:hypothetical protein